MKLIQSSIYPIELLMMSEVYDASTKKYNFFTYTKEEEAIILEQFPMLRVFQVWVKYDMQGTHWDENSENMTKYAELEINFEKYVRKSPGNKLKSVWNIDKETSHYVTYFNVLLMFWHFMNICR